MKDLGGTFEWERSEKNVKRKIDGNFCLFVYSFVPKEGQEEEVKGVRLDGTWFRKEHGYLNRIPSTAISM